MTMGFRNRRGGLSINRALDGEDDDIGRYAKAADAYRASTANDPEILNRALGILHRFGTENTGWWSFFRRWYYSDEPLRNDAANLVREAGFGMMMPRDTRLVGDDR